MEWYWTIPLALVGVVACVLIGALLFSWGLVSLGDWWKNV